MKKSIALFALAALAFVGCKKESDKTEVTTSEKDTIHAQPTPSETLNECYAFVQQKDTIALSISQNGAEVNGNLRFKNYEKDSSKGEVKGQFSGDTLKLDYTFQSEGTTSVREMRFLKSGNALVMGIGDMDEKDGKLCFSKPSAVKYDKSMVLVKTECD